MQLLKPSWVHHNDGQAIFSVDIHPDGSRFATGGQGQDASGRVVIWNMKPVISEKHEQDSNCPKLLCQLDQHLGCVNCVRWSQSGRYLASAGDDKVVIIWQLSNYGGGAVFGSNVVNVEWWRSVSTLRGHDGDILDVAWAPHDVYLASVSVDNTVIIWNTAKWPERIRILRGHRGLVKGVTWDPVGRYVASQADDRTLIVWRTSDWGQEVAITKPFLECGGTTSVLRPSWSPDGQYLVSAHAMNNGGPTAKIIDRDNWTIEKDFVGHRKPITCVRFNPNILKKIQSKTGKAVQYCCAAIGSRDRSLSIWFTSLKRPLVVVHDVFEDSVLDLAFSGCGRHLFAVSKDGTMAAISFVEDEMGQTLSQEEIDSVYFKLYGKCSSRPNPTPTAAAIIDNPELLRARQQALSCQQQQQQHHETNSTAADTTSRSPQRRGPDKQIEMRTADGRRRITPVFIPPSADGGSMKKFESFSTSRTEKSRIIIEKLDDIVEPNISTPCKSNTNSCSGYNNNQLPGNANSNSNTPTSVTSSAVTASAKNTGDKNEELPEQANKTTACTSMPPPTVEQQPIDGVTPELSARLESRSIKNGNDRSVPMSDTASGVKRKFEEPQPIAVKRKRGRPPLDRSSSHHPASPPPVTPSLPVLPPAPAAPAAILRSAPAPVVQGAKIAYNRNLLPEASFGKSHRVQVRSKEASFVITAENNWREMAGARSLHRVSRYTHGSIQWSAYTSSLITALTATENFVVVTCSDASLHLFCVNTGGLLLPPLQLNGGASKLCATGAHLLVLTTTAHLNHWNVTRKKTIKTECVRHIVEGRAGQDGVKSIHLLPNQEYSQDNLSKHLQDNTAHAVNGVGQSNGVGGTNGEALNGHAKNSKGAPKESVALCNGAKEKDVPHPADTGPVQSKSLNNIKDADDLSPVIVLGSGEVFGLCRSLDTWLQLGECEAVRKIVTPQYTSLPSALVANDERSSPLATLLRHTAAHTMTSAQNEYNGGPCDSELRSVLTENYIKKMLTASVYLSSKTDFKFWYTRLIHFYIREGREELLRSVFDEMLSKKCSNSNGQHKISVALLPSHDKLLDCDKTEYLRSLLSDLLLVDSSGRLQRLYTEYRELLESQSSAPADLQHAII